MKAKLYLARNASMGRVCFDGSTSVEAKKRSPGSGEIRRAGFCRQERAVVFCCARFCRAEHDRKRLLLRRLFYDTRFCRAGRSRKSLVAAVSTACYGRAPGLLRDERPRGVSAFGRAFAGFDAAEGAGTTLPFLGDAVIASNADAFAVHLSEDVAAPRATAFAIAEAAIEGAHLATRLIERGFGHGGAAVLATNAGHEAGPGVARLLLCRLGVKAGRPGRCGCGGHPRQRHHSVLTIQCATVAPAYAKENEPEGGSE
jgi:hypothetical protein